MKVKYSLCIVMLMVIFACGNKSSRSSLDHIIHIYIDTKKVKGAMVFWRIESMVDGVHSTNRFLLGLTPYWETRSIYIPGLTKDNASDVYVVVEIYKKAYYRIIERFNMKSILNERRISKIFTLYSKDYKKTYTDSKTDIITRVKSKPIRSGSKYSKVVSKPVATKPLVKKTIPLKLVPVIKIKEDIKKVEVPALSSIVRDIYEPNNSLGKAKSIYLNREYLAKIGSNNDIDYYVIFLSSKLDYRFTIDKDKVNSKIKIAIKSYRKNSKTIFEHTISNNKDSVIVNIGNKGYKSSLYCIKVSGDSSDITYKIKASLSK